ncbi:MAG: pyrroloquinoline quinone biosynthesis protein PqqB [Balneolaceae bacterium]|nr:pyrroloquinoline quinone biosynthesis protein PqqB [Balneolaceae bacterium]
MKYYALLLISILLSCTHQPEKKNNKPNPPSGPFLSVLGIAQDAGFPQANCEKENCTLYWDGIEEKRHVVSLGLADPVSGKQWMFEATPDFPVQLHQLKKESGISELSGIFLTHAHIGHYTGLMYLGHEAMGASGIPVYAMPRMKSYLEENGPWSQLVDFSNIQLQKLNADSAIQLTETLSVVPFRVPHRDEYSETVGYRIESLNKKILFIPDINKWHVWERDIVAEIAKVDVALLDGSFYDSTELPGRNMSEIPHPYVEESMELFAHLPDSEKRKITFIHFNHTNPLLLDSPERTEVEAQGYSVAFEGMHIQL